MWKTLALCALLCAASSATSSTHEVQQVNSSCPTWTYPSQHCKCGNPLQRIIHCTTEDNQTTVEIIFGYCMTLDSSQTAEVVGSCPFNFQRPGYRYQYLRVPSVLPDLESVVCGYTNRTGQMCGQCVNGTSPPVYSYYPQCVHCPKGTNNWPKYLAVSLLPTTLFFLGTVALRFRATSPLMIGFILHCQICTSPPVLRRLGFAFFNEYNTFRSWGTFFALYISYLSIWNLDFFRMVYTPFCLQPNVSTLQVLSLDYIVAAYPLALIILTYTLVTLHYYNNCRVVVWLWRLFHKCSARFRRQWNLQNSLVDAFATFLLLSYVKFLGVSFNILMPTFLWDKWGQQKSIMLYYDGSVEYFGKEHLPYAILAIAVLLVFTLLPIMLLCLYPRCWFQKLLNSCHLQSQALRMFMDTFQGCYKDGTNGTRDCRMFSALYLITRVVAYLPLGFGLASLRVITIVSILLTLILLVTCYRPYKKDFYNKLDVFFFLILIGTNLTLANCQYEETRNKMRINGALYVPLFLTHVTYIPCLALYYIWKTSKRLQLVTAKIQTLCLRSKVTQTFKESLPQRVMLDETTSLLKKKEQSQYYYT